MKKPTIKIIYYDCDVTTEYLEKKHQEIIRKRLITKYLNDYVNNTETKSLS